MVEKFQIFGNFSDGFLNEQLNAADLYGGLLYGETERLQIENDILKLKEQELDILKAQSYELDGQNDALTQALRRQHYINDQLELGFNVDPDMQSSIAKALDSYSIPQFEGGGFTGYGMDPFLALLHPNELVLPLENLPSKAYSQGSQTSISHGDVTLNVDLHTNNPGEMLHALDTKLKTFNINGLQGLIQAARG